MSEWLLDEVLDADKIKAFLGKGRGEGGVGVVAGILAQPQVSEGQ